MILFLDDWKKYPTAQPDLTTKNISFIRMAVLYKKMGIKNNAFMLALINQNLIGIDPFDPDLSMEQKAWVALECKLNPWYYFREVAKAPPISGNTPVAFEANRGNMSAYWLFFNHITFILIQIRQSGKSFSMDQLNVLLLNILCSNTEINLLTKDDTLRSKNIASLKNIDSELPLYLKQRTKFDANNTEEITIRSRKNIYRAHVPQMSAKAALKVGRGLTSPIFMIDEAPFQPNIEIALPAALAAGTRARDIARANGEPYGTAITTTAGKRDDRDGRYCYNLVQESAEWSEKMLDCANIEELEQMIRRNSPKGQLRVNCTFNHTQLGKTDEWLVRAIEEAMVDGEAADRDFFNRWTSGTQTHPLALEVLEVIRASQEPDKFVSTEAPYSYITRWYIEEYEIPQRMATCKFVMGMDTSDASGGDDISLYLIDIATGETIATGRYNETNLITFCQWLVTWFVKYDNFIAIIERKSSGVAILDYLLLMLPAVGIDPFKRLFNMAVNEHIENPERFKEINLPLGRRPSYTYVTYKKCFGFITTGSGYTSRSELYSTILQLAAKKAGGKIKDLTTINQLTGLTTKNGRIDHAPGEHDDMVIAWLLCFWFINQGKNLSYYDIDSRMILSKAEKPKIMDRQTYLNNQQQNQLKQEMQRIYEDMGNESDSYVLERLEKRLRFLNTQLVLEEGDKFSLDELINSLKEKRRNRINQNNYSNQANTSYSNYGSPYSQRRY